MPYCDRKKVIFLHVPKTGGKTVREIFDLPLLYNSDPAIKPSPQHLTCQLLRQRIGGYKYDCYYKFVFIRNPWARIVSSYFWRQSLPIKRVVPQFSEFIQNLERVVSEQTYYDQEFGDHFIPQVEYAELIDEIFRFEKFQQSIEKIAKKLNIPTPHVPPKKVKPYDEYWKFYNDQTRKIIARTYRKEIEMFGYEFKNTPNNHR